MCLTKISMDAFFCCFSPPNVMRTMQGSNSNTPYNNDVGSRLGHKLSPSEERALQAEKRAASRQARCVLNNSISICFLRDRGMPNLLNPCHAE